MPVDKFQMKNLILIDDETDYSETMGFWLMAQGYEVRTASSGKEGIAMITFQCPDVVFLDMRMPEMDGIDTLKKIREINPQLPVIMVTAYASEEKKAEAVKLGVSGFFNKSDDFSEAAKLIKDALEKM